MLVLTRKSQQSIMIGDQIEITILAIKGEAVRLGIEAPREIPLYRTELYREIRAERGAVSALDNVGAESAHST